MGKHPQFVIERWFGDVHSLGNKANIDKCRLKFTAPPTYFVLASESMSIEIERGTAITWVRIQMARHGLTLADLKAAGCFAEPNASFRGAVCYRNAEGQNWDGRDAMPGWLQRAIHAGQSVEHFRVSPTK